jgi:flagellar biosynthesis/type III secretory pathway chaperone
VTTVSEIIASKSLTPTEKSRRVSELVRSRPRPSRLNSLYAEKVRLLSQLSRVEQAIRREESR